MNKFVSLLVFLNLGFLGFAHAEGGPTAPAPNELSLKLATELSTKVSNEANVPITTVIPPAGIGELRLGMSREAVDALVGDETAVISPLTAFQAPTVEVLGVYRTKVKTPLSEQPLPAILKFDEAQKLKGIKLELPEAAYLRTVSRFTEKYGNPSTTYARKLGTCELGKKRGREPGAELSFTSISWTSALPENAAAVTEVSSYFLDACPGRPSTKSASLRMREYWVSIESSPSLDEKSLF